MTHGAAGASASGLQHNISVDCCWLAADRGIVLYRFCHDRDAAATAIDGFRIGLPIFGKIWLKYQVALFARTLSTLLTGGLPLVPSLETAARSISSRKRIARRCMSSIDDGARRQEPGASRWTRPACFPIWRRR